MTRRQYLREVLRLYLAEPDTPATSRRRDSAIAANFYDRQLPIETLAHVFRLATLRRHSAGAENEAPEPIHSLAYFREVLRRLTPDMTEPEYVEYVAQRHKALLEQLHSTPPDL